MSASNLVIWNNSRYTIKKLEFDLAWKGDFQIVESKNEDFLPNERIEYEKFPIEKARGLKAYINLEGKDQWQRWPLGINLKKQPADEVEIKIMALNKIRLRYTTFIDGDKRLKKDPKKD
jgi:hypothetical protein